MKNLFIPGMQANPKDFERIKQLFGNERIKVNGLLSSHRIILGMKKDDIKDLLYRKIDLERDDVTLICHSMGCNIGILAAAHPAVQKLVLVSPEIIDASKEEKRRTNKIALQKYSYEIPSGGKSNASVIEKLRLVNLFLKSKKWALESIKDVDSKTMVVYSEGDSFVSRVGVEYLVEQMSAEKVMVETANHNPFLSSKGSELVKRMKPFLK